MNSSCPTFSILGIGSVPYDCLFYMNARGDLQETLETPGGSVANVLCALSRLGARAAIAGVVGADEEGEKTRRHLERFGVRTDWLQRRTGRRTRRLRIEVRARAAAADMVEGLSPIPGHRFVHHSPGKGEVSMRDLNPSPGWRKRAIEDFDWLHFDTPTRITLQMAREAAQRGKPVSYDFGRPPLWGVEPAIQLAESCTALKTNRPLVAALGGSDDPQSLFGRFERLRFLLVTDGEKDAQLWWRGGNPVAPSAGEILNAARAIIPATRVVDTIGAGDSCTAALIQEVAAATGLCGTQSIPFTPDWAQGVLGKAAALSAMVCQFPGATGYLHWLRKHNCALDSLLGSIIKDGRVPESCHLSLAECKRFY